MARAIRSSSRVLSHAARRRRGRGLDCEPARAGVRRAGYRSRASGRAALSREPRALALIPVLAVQANEVGTREGPEPNQVALALCEEVDCLGPAAADRLDQASRFSQLLSKRSHRVREGGGHENCLERGLVRKSL